MTRPNELRADVRLTGDQQAKRGLKDVGDAADKAGDKLREMGDDAGFLTKEIAKAETQYKQLIQTLDQTGDEALLKQIRAERRRMRQLDQLKKELTGAAAEASTGQGGQSVIGEGIAKGLGAAIAAGGPYVIGGVGVVLASLLPFLGGAISSAVVGAAGTGGIIGGIALASRDQRVKDAASDLGKSALESFTVAAEPFIDEALDAMDTLKVAAGEVAAEMGVGFDALAPVVKPLTEGLAGFAKNLRLGEVFASSVPILRVIAKELPDIGRSIGDLFLIITEDSDGAILAFQQLSDMIQGTVRWAGIVLAVLSKVYEAGVRTASVMSNILADFTMYIPILGDLMEGNADKWQSHLDALNEIKGAQGDLKHATTELKIVTYGLGDAARYSAEGIDAQRQAISHLLDVELGAIEGQVALERAMDRMTEATKENGKTLDITTEAGRRNTEAITQNIREVERQANAIRDQALAHGATAQEAEAAAQAFLDRMIPAMRALVIQTYGNTAAVQTLINKLELLNGQVFSYTLVQRGGRTLGAEVPGGFIPAGLEGRASGGPVEPHRLYRVNETGIEFLQTGSQGGYVLNAAKTQQMMSGASAAPRLTFSPTPPPSDGTFWLELVRMAWPYILQQIRVDGGDLSAFGAA